MAVVASAFGGEAPPFAATPFDGFMVAGLDDGFEANFAIALRRDSTLAFALAGAFRVAARLFDDWRAGR